MKSKSGLRNSIHSVTISSASAPVSAAEQSFAAGEAVGRQLAGAGLCGVHVLSDGLLVNGSELVRGMLRRLPPGVQVTGGLAGAAGVPLWIIGSRKVVVRKKDEKGPASPRASAPPELRITGAGASLRWEF